MATIRVFLGLLALFFAYFLGRVGAGLHVRRLPVRRAITWLLRTAVTLAGVYWPGGFDLMTIVWFTLAAGAFAFGVYLEVRPRKVEDIHIAPQD